MLELEEHRDIIQRHYPWLDKGTNDQSGHEKFKKNIKRLTTRIISAIAKTGMDLSDMVSTYRRYREYFLDIIADEPSFLNSAAIHLLKSITQELKDLMEIAEAREREIYLHNDFTGNPLTKEPTLNYFWFCSQNVIGYLEGDCFKKN